VVSGEPLSMLTVTATALQETGRYAAAMLEVGGALAPETEGGQDCLAAAAVSSDGVRLRSLAWADPSKRREIAGDPRAAMLCRLTDDGPLGGESDGGD
jgi:hypothetical protein